MGAVATILIVLATMLLALLTALVFGLLFRNLIEAPAERDPAGKNSNSKHHARS